MMSDFRFDDSFPVKTGSWGQISNFVKSRQIIVKNEGLDVNYSKNVAKRSFKVIQGQKSQKKNQKGSNFEKFLAKS